MVTASVADGASLTTGGDFKDLFYSPTVLADVPVTASAFGEEVFGPVAPVTKVGSVDEAIRLAAESEYGLSLGIVTPDVMRGLDIAERIPTGIVHINDQTVNDEANAPFGGVRGVRDGLPLRRSRGEHRSLHRDTLDHDARGARHLPLLSRLVTGRRLLNCNVVRPCWTYYC